MKPLIHVEEHDEGGYLAQEVIYDDVLSKYIENRDPINSPEVKICELFHINEGKWDGSNHHFEDDQIYNTNDENGTMESEAEVSLIFIKDVIADNIESMHAKK